MAQDWSDKTQAATPRRRQEAREAGQIVRSPDLAAAVVVLGMLVILSATGPGLVKAMQGMLREWLGGASLANSDPAATLSQMRHALWAMGGALAPLLLGAMVLALAGNVAQFGFVFTPRRLRPDPGHLSPVKGMGRIFSSAALGRLALGVVKLLVVLAVAWSCVRPRLGQITALQNLECGQVLNLCGSIFYAVAVRLALVLLVLGLVDYAHRRFVHERELRMTPREVQDEMRTMEGDPKLKQRRLQMARQWAVNRRTKGSA